MKPASSSLTSGSIPRTLFAFALPIPALAGLVGFDLFLQSWAPAPSANAAGVVVSNGLVWRIGNW